MAVTVTQEMNGKLLVAQVSGKLTDADYQQFTPACERLIAQHGKIRVLFQMHDFHGWEPGAIWDDIKFDVKHFKDIERIAMVGETKWQKWMAAVCKPFTSAKIRYFDSSQLSQARAWIEAPEV